MLLLGRKTSLERVAAFLREMDPRLTAAGVMALPMSRRDIADYLGLTLETVSRALSHLHGMGILGFLGQTRRQIVLLDRVRLAEMDLQGEAKSRLHFREARRTMRQISGVANRRFEIHRMSNARYRD